ncbi:MAG: SRPBCC domain-containing protein [Devosia sp.]
MADVIPFRPRRPTGWLEAYVRFWEASLDQLTAYIDTLKSRETPMSDIKFEYPEDEPTMICTRSFDAPVSLVWRAFTDPAHVARWWGPKSYAPVKKIDKLELRKGGQWRFVCARPDGSQEIVFAGVYLDVQKEAKLVNTFGVEGQFEGDAAYPETHTFEERAGRTYYRSFSRLPDMASREAVIATGMEKGGRESMEQLGELVDELAREKV